MIEESVISFHISLNSVCKVLPIVIDESYTGKNKVPLYYKTSKQLSVLEGITGIVIPVNIDDKYPRNDYSPIELIKRIRLLKDKKISRLPIFIHDGDNDDFSESDENLKIGVYFKGYSPGKPYVNDLDLDTIIHSFGNEIPLEEHDITNLWSPYRLAQLLQYFGISKLEYNDLERLKNRLLEKCFFQKLIRQESLREKNTSITKGETYGFKSKLESIRNKNLLIGVIDDEIHSGWGAAYEAFFGKSNIEFVYPPLSQNGINNSTKRETNFNSFILELNNGKFKLHKYDLIILDLRLYEKSKHSSSDILDVEKISGIRVLEAIKKNHPFIPVIICTASNKFWSYNIASNFGAEGFWSKESPQYGVTSNYQFYNTYNLIKTVTEVLEWSFDIGPIFKTMKEIAESVDNDIIKESVEKKLNIVFSQLHISKNKYVERFFGQSGLTTAYLAVHSLRNDFIELRIIKKKTSCNVKIKEKEYKFCDYDDSKNKPFILTEDTYQCLANEKWQPYHDYKNFPENLIISYILKKSFNDKLEPIHRECNNIRNYLDIIHKKPYTKNNSTHYPKLSINKLKELLDIYYRIFLNKKSK
jgi:CheY-like chemotaxis protein